jgi:hypothetical protein
VDTHPPLVRNRDYSAIPARQAADPSPGKTGRLLRWETEWLQRTDASTLSRSCRISLASHPALLRA